PHGVAPHVPPRPLLQVALPAPHHRCVRPTVGRAGPVHAAALLPVSVKRCTSKVAVTNLDALMVTVQVVSRTVSHPVQPAKIDPVPGVAVRVTLVPPL